MKNYLFTFYPENLRIVILETLQDINPEIFSKNMWCSKATAYFNGNKEVFCTRKITPDTQWILINKKSDGRTLLLIDKEYVKTNTEIYTGNPELDFMVNSNLHILISSISVLETIPVHLPPVNVENEMEWLDSEDASEALENSEIAEETIRA